MTNALLGNVSVLGVSDGISNEEIAPGMNPSPDESERWIVTVNLSAGEITDQEMLSDVADLEVRTVPFCVFGRGVMRVACHSILRPFCSRRYLKYVHSSRV